MILDFGDSAIKGADHLTWLGAEYLFRQFAQIALYAVAIWSLNERFHAGLAIAILLYNVGWVIRYYPTFE